MTRVREESSRLGTHEGTLRALAVTGGVITSAGLVLAATFSVLAVLPLVTMTEIGFVVAFGVLLDTLVVRSLLVPALTFELDHRIWWPSALSRPPAPPAPKGARPDSQPVRTGGGSRWGGHRRSRQPEKYGSGPRPVPPSPVYWRFRLGLLALRRS